MSKTKVGAAIPPSIHVVEDEETGVVGVIAIDSTALGPAAGGCRLWRYPDEASLRNDARRLARGMTFKNAMADLPFGGGKAVLQLPEAGFDRKRLLRAFADAVERLGGAYVTAEDVGTNVADMTFVSQRTRYVAGINARTGGAGGDPSPWTARGVFDSMRVAAGFCFGAELSQLRVAVQGAGAVGGRLCRLLAEAGAQVIVADIDAARCEQLGRIDGVRIAPVDQIAGVEADIFAPCALGGALDARSVGLLKAKLVCGAANNQLADDDVAEHLMDRGVTYVPDYVANAGGIISVAGEYLGESAAQVEERLGQIAGRVEFILKTARAKQVSPALVADDLAQKILANAGSPRNRNGQQYVGAV